MIQKTARISLSHSQLLIEGESGATTLPIEDITALVLESPQISLSSALLAKCAENSVAVITCDASHIPNGLMLPFHPHSRQSRVAHIQQSWSEPLRKRLWQLVVQCKIRNQAYCLNATNQIDTAKRLFAMAERVKSGDPDNYEAQAARIYWQSIMGNSFRRGADDSINAALNYGYAIVRAFVARSQVAYGLLPTFGIHHDNDLNAFNLTDDMMEVFRPLVDFQVWEMKQAETLTPDISNLSIGVRQQLAGIGSHESLISGQRHNLHNACDKMAAGLVSAIEQKSALLLPLPEFIARSQPEENL
jgi:CRISPR-associated protein Cas1